MGPLERQVESFVQENLPDDPETWCAGAKKKIIHDALWGTFPLHRHEVALLDTPLLQRLRFLHQTGAVYLTYPSAHHTRFEHTLGVLCQASRLCTGLRRNSDERRITDALENEVRCAALMHDTGHGPFSHTSEQFFSALPELQEFREAHSQLEHSGGGEILSYLITTSQPFREFIRVVGEQCQIDLSPDTVGRLITGTMPDDQIYKSEIVHGPFDADKIDYMPRDGMFSGLRMHVDIDRLYNSIHIRTADVGGGRQTRLAGSTAGLSPLQQLLFNRMLLFTGMYHHHKVRAVDCMLWAVFKLAVERECDVGGVSLQGPADFLRVTDDRLLIQELATDNDVRGIVDSIRRRRLWKKALVIARSTVPEEMYGNVKDSSGDLLAGVMLLAGDEPENLRRKMEIALQIWEAAGKPCKSHEVWLDVPRLPGVTEAKQMWIEPSQGAQPQTLDEFIPISHWVELYGIHQARAHVFCPPEHCRLIGQAAEDVLKEMFKLTFLDQAKVYSRN